MGGETYLGCLEMDHNPEEINFSSCFLLSFSDLHCDFSIRQQRSKRAQRCVASGFGKFREEQEEE